MSAMRAERGPAGIERVAVRAGPGRPALVDPHEPDPVPQPANPSPETLQYVTVYDNRDRGGFAGSKPVGQPEAFRCGFSKAQGSGAQLEG